MPEVRRSLVEKCLFALGAFHRPIVASGLQLLEDHFYGNRPVQARRLPLQEDSPLPNARPIASNEIDDPRELMGFLD